jgi:hypothetical protein
MLEGSFDNLLSIYFSMFESNLRFIAGKESLDYNTKIKGMKESSFKVGKKEHHDW